jgi:hypothetical protein
MRKVKQRIDKSEPYFVHVGYAFVNELRLRHPQRRLKGKYSNTKVRTVVQARLAKLKKYWGLACM